MQIGATSPNTGVLASLSDTSSSSAASAASDPLMSIAPSGNNSSDLMKFLQMTPAQKMEYQWMSSHKITQQSLSQMSQTQRDALRDRMASDLKQKAQQDMEAKTAKANGGVNVVV